MPTETLQVSPSGARPYEVFVFFTPPSPSPWLSVPLPLPRARGGGGRRWSPPASVGAPCGAAVSCALPALMAMLRARPRPRPPCLLPPCRLPGRGGCPPGRPFSPPSAFARCARRARPPSRPPRPPRFPPRPLPVGRWGGRGRGFFPPPPPRAVRSVVAAVRPLVYL